MNYNQSSLVMSPPVRSFSLNGYSANSDFGYGGHSFHKIRNSSCSSIPELSESPSVRGSVSSSDSSDGEDFSFRNRRARTSGGAVVVSPNLNPVILRPTSANSAKSVPTRSYHRSKKSLSQSNSTYIYPYQSSRHTASVYSLDFINPSSTPPVPPLPLYLSQRRKSTPLPSDGASIFNLNQTFLASNLQENASSLLPRIKTIELYRKNAKRSKDPLIQFQLAQYMMQTALLSGPVASAKSCSSDDQITPSTTSSSSSGSTSTNSSVSSSMIPHDEDKIKKELLKESVSYLYKLSLAGYPDAQYLLGDAYSSGALGKTDFKESFNQFQMAAKHGHAEAAYRAALCFEEGWGVTKDSRKAIQYLRQASSKSHPGAMFRLGLACFYGQLGMHLTSSTANKVRIQIEGIKWLTRATESANATFPRGPFELARLYEIGYKDILFKDVNYAVELYAKSSNLGYVPAAARLGHLYEYGELGLPQDATLSINYYNTAALGGDSTSMLAMCAWYMVGVDSVLPRSEEEAYRWARRAADKGLAKAEFATGFFLENGVGCVRDILKSAEYYKRAAKGGDQRAIDRLDNKRPLQKTTTPIVNSLPSDTVNNRSSSSSSNSNRNSSSSSSSGGIPVSAVTAVSAVLKKSPSKVSNGKKKTIKREKSCIIM